METHARSRLGVATSRVITSELAGRQSSIQIEGALDALTVDEIRSAIDAVVADHPRRVTVDIAHVTLLDSSGVGAIVSLFRRLKAQGGQMVVVHAHDQPLAILRLLKLDAVFGV